MIHEAPTPPKMRYDDPRLLLNISQAAFELDRAARNEPAELEKAKFFFDFLTESISSEEHKAEEGTYWVDPITVNVFTQALRDSGRAQTMRTVHDVVQEALKVVHAIHRTTESGTGAELEELRDFCIAFGNSLLSYRAQHRPQPPTHPYRR